MDVAELWGKAGDPGGSGVMAHAGREQRASSLFLAKESVLGVKSPRSSVKQAAPTEAFRRGSTMDMNTGLASPPPSSPRLGHGVPQVSIKAAGSSSFQSLATKLVRVHSAAGDLAHPTAGTQSVPNTSQELAHWAAASAGMPPARCVMAHAGKMEGDLYALQAGGEHCARSAVGAGNHVRTMTAVSERCAWGAALSLHLSHSCTHLRTAAWRWAQKRC